MAGLLGLVSPSRLREMSYRAITLSLETLTLEAITEFGGDDKSVTRTVTG